MGIRVRATDLERGKKGVTSGVLATSLALYAVSFLLPAWDDPGAGMVRGYAAFSVALFGPLIYSIGGFAALFSGLDPTGLLILVALLPWCANIAYGLAAYCLHIERKYVVVALGVLAVVLGLSAWLPVTYFWLSFPVERRGPPPFAALREGYWLWLGSMALLAYGGWRGTENRRGGTAAEERAQSCDD
jgi:hypothetical protein